MKKITFVIMVNVILFLSAVTYSSAAGVEEVNWRGKGADVLLINEDLTVVKFRDGRVKPVDENIASNLTELELDSILVFMGHDPSKLALDSKVDIVTIGGKAAESNSYKLKIKEYDEDGQFVSEEVTDLNEDNDSNNVSIMGGSSTNQCAFYTGCFQGSITVNYIGKSGSNHQYRFYYDYRFPNGSNGYNDFVGLAWKGTGTKKANSDVTKHYIWSGSSYVERDLSRQDFNLYGSVYNVRSATAPFYGYYRADVYYSDRLTGDHEILAGNYGANWQSIFNSISIGPASINISNTEKQYILEKNFTVGK